MNIVIQNIIKCKKPYSKYNIPNETRGSKIKSSRRDKKNLIKARRKEKENGRRQAAKVVEESLQLGKRQECGH